MWVQCPVILQQRMLTMPQVSDGLKGRLLSPAGCEVHSQTDYAKICWEKLNTSPSSCQPFTSLFVSYSYSYSYALCFRPCLSGTSTVISSRFLPCLWQGRSHPSGASTRSHSVFVWDNKTILLFHCFQTSGSWVFLCTTARPKWDPVIAAKFVRIYFTYKRY